MAEYICMECHSLGKPRRIKRGNGKLEFLGWMLFPRGVPYSLWRLIAKQRVCGQCGSSFLESITSPVGMRVLSGVLAFSEGLFFNRELVWFVRIL